MMDWKAGEKKKKKTGTARQSWRVCTAHAPPDPATSRPSHLPSGVIHGGRSLLLDATMPPTGGGVLVLQHRVLLPTPQNTHTHTHTQHTKTQWQTHTHSHRHWFKRTCRLYVISALWRHLMKQSTQIGIHTLVEVSSMCGLVIDRIMYANYHIMMLPQFSCSWCNQMSLLNLRSGRSIERVYYIVRRLIK